MTSRNGGSILQANKIPWQNLRYTTGVRRQLVDIEHVLRAWRASLMLPKDDFGYIIKLWMSHDPSAQSLGLAKIATKIRVFLAHILCGAAGGTHADAQLRPVCKARSQMNGGDDQSDTTEFSKALIAHCYAPLDLRFCKIRYEAVHLPQRIHSSYLLLIRTETFGLTKQRYV